MHASYTPAEDDYGVFKAKIVRVEGKTLSLNELENEVIAAIKKGMN